MVMTNFKILLVQIRTSVYVLRIYIYIYIYIKCIKKTDALKYPERIELSRKTSNAKIVIGSNNLFIDKLVYCAHTVGISQ